MDIDSNKSYKIRAAVSEDRQAIAEIYVKSWNFAYKGIVPQEFLDNLNEKKYLDRLKEKDVPDEVVFELNGRVVGLAKLIDCRDRDLENTVEVQTIYFLPEFTGRGYGVLLLDWLRDYAVSAGYKKIIIWGLSANLRAGKAYMKAGLAKDIDRFIEIGGKQLQETRYIMGLK